MKLKFKELLENKYILIKYMYFLQDKYYLLSDQNNQFKLSISQKSKENYYKVLDLVNEKDRDLGILIRKTELLDDNIFRSFKCKQLDVKIKQSFQDLLIMQKQYYHKWSSWNLSYK